MLCERILRRDGKEALFQVMSEGVDPWPAPAYLRQARAVRHHAGDPYRGIAEGIGAGTVERAVTGRLIGV